MIPESYVICGPCGPSLASLASTSVSAARLEAPHRQGLGFDLRLLSLAASQGQHGVGGSAKSSLSACLAGGGGCRKRCRASQKVSARVPETDDRCMA